MKLNKTYQSKLRNQCSTCIDINTQWSLLYKNHTIYGAYYCNDELMYVNFPCGLQVYSKSLQGIKRYIRAYVADKLDI